MCSLISILLVDSHRGSGAGCAGWLCIGSSDLGRVLEYFLETFLEAIYVIIDQMLLVNLSLVNETDQSQAFVDFPQIQHDVLLVICMCQSNNA